MARKLIDLTGQVFGQLTVIERVPNKGGKTCWKCKCDCGKEISVVTNNLRRGNSVSCGCLKGFNIAKGIHYPLYTQYARGARNRGHAFELTETEFIRLTAGNCIYCGVSPLLIREFRKVKKESNFVHNGIDRQDNSVGYTAENCVTCCSICNKAKHVLSMEAWADWILRITTHNSPKPPQEPSKAPNLPEAIDYPQRIKRP